MSIACFDLRIRANDYQLALEAVYAFMQTNIAEGSAEEAELLRLSELVETYESKHHSIGEQTDPVEAINMIC